MGSPRDDVVFRLWQCDKRITAGVKAALTVPCQSFDLLAGPSPSGQNQLRTKKRITLCAAGRALLNQKHWPGLNDYTGKRNT